MGMLASTLAHPLVRGRFLRWLRKRLTEDVWDAVDPGVFDRSLTFSEAKAEAEKRFGPMFRMEDPQRVKKIVFVRELIPKVLAGEVQCTYRPSRMAGFYYVVDSRFKKDPQVFCLIEVSHSEAVDVDALTDADAALAGVGSGDAIRTLFRRWYGEPWVRGALTMYRNWFRLIK